MNKFEYRLGLPHAEYRKLEGINSHGLALASKSLAHYKWDLDHAEESKDSPAFKIGRAVHVAVLERAQFERYYAVQPASATKPTWNKKPENYTQAEKEWLAYQEVAKATEKELLTYDEADLAISIANHLRFDTAVRDYLHNAETEVTIRWEEMGCWCKARPDAVNQSKKTLIDLKTTASAASEDFQKSIFNFHYIHQLAWYRRACQACGIEIKETVIIAVEKDPPYGYAIYRLNTDDLDLADRCNFKVFDSIRIAKQTGVFPGYPSGVQNIRISDWAEANMKGEIENA